MDIQMQLVFKLGEAYGVESGYKWELLFGGKVMESGLERQEML